MLRGVLDHVLLFIVNFFVLVGLVSSLQTFSEELPPLNLLVLGYSVVHTFILLCIQLGVQVLQLVRLRAPTVLVTYYFQFSDEELIPVPLFDPTKSKLAVIVLLLVISGGPVMYPIYAVYGALLVVTVLARVGVDPGTIVRYFEIFVNWMPPLMGVVVVIVIVSIVAIESKHI